MGGMCVAMEENSLGKYYLSLAFGWVIYGKTLPEYTFFLFSLGLPLHGQPAADRFGVLGIVFGTTVRGCNTPRVIRSI